MNFPFLKNFVNKELNLLPPVTQRRVDTRVSIRQSFEDYVTRNGTLRNLPPIQRMSDPERIARMQREMNEQSNDERE